MYFLSNYWDAWAGKIEPDPRAEDSEAWLRDVNKLEQLQATSGQFGYATSGRYYKTTKFERIAWIAFAEPNRFPFAEL